MKKTKRIFVDIVGQKFGRLLVLEYTSKRIRNQITWKCVCDCDNIIVVPAGPLKNGNTKSCGCLWLEVARETIIKYHTKHGKANSRIYRLYKGMLNRCRNKKGQDYYLYGGRGIKVCDRWLNEEGFINFYNDMGCEYEMRVSNGEKISLDRYPNLNGNYEPSNCRWATDQMQSENTRIFGKALDKKKHLRWKELLSGSLRGMLFGGFKTSKNFIYVGCTIKELRQHISSKFTIGMNWNNHGKYTMKNKNVWNIDHIIPCYKFDLDIEKDRYECFNYKNLRPMWGKDNLHLRLR